MTNGTPSPDSNLQAFCNGINDRFVLVSKAQTRKLGFSEMCQQFMCRESVLLSSTPIIYHAQAEKDGESPGCQPGMATLRAYDKYSLPVSESHPLVIRLA